VTSTDRAELDSTLNTIEDVIRRVTAAAERNAGTSDESFASDLYDVERSLQAAARRLAIVVRRLDE
jgi:hypothetical protein